jgi:hypothetical protein
MKGSLDIASMIFLVLMVASIGIVMTVPAYMRSNLLFIIPVLFFLCFLYTMRF